MQARILEKSQEHLWDKFIETHPLSTIHQYSKWGHFQEKIPSRGKYWIVVLEEMGVAEEIIGGTMLIRHKLPKGFSWLYSARGPLVDYTSSTLAQSQIDALISEIKKIASMEKSIFLRIDPLSDPKGCLANNVSKANSLSAIPRFKNFHITHKGFQPEHTLILDITKSEEEILKEMKPKGRYNIKLAEKKGVKIRKSDISNAKKFDEDLDAFYKILLETTSRDGFSGHDKNFYKIMLETLAPKAELYLAEYDNKIIAGILVTFFKDTAIYYYGASSDEHRNLMAPYLLQWTAIKDAKSKNLKYYDFLGIAPENAKNHPWKGVTEFKKKFGGKEVTYAPPQEFAFKKIPHFLYGIYKMLKK